MSDGPRETIGDCAGAIARAVCAVFLSLLPRRRWEAYDGFPLGSASLVSAVVTVGAGASIGVTGFLSPPVPFIQVLALPVFLFATVPGWLTMYLLVSGTLRAMAWSASDAMGDPILTALDGWLTARRHSSTTESARRNREALEGPDVPDRLLPASWAGLTDADVVVVAARRKPDWTRGSCVITDDKWFTLGEPFDLQLPQGLRTIYPLTEQKVNEVLRRGVRYDLPPLLQPRRPAVTSRAPRAPASTPPARTPGARSRRSPWHP